MTGVEGLMIPVGRCREHRQGPAALGRRIRICAGSSAPMRAPSSRRPRFRTLYGKARRLLAGRSCRGARDQGLGFARWPVSARRRRRCGRRRRRDRPPAVAPRN
jgi:hypothetical protein